MTTRERIRSTVLRVALLLLVCVPAPAPALQHDGGATIWLVRHAERADAHGDPAPDPELSPEGHARAAELARLLGEAGITSLHSTDYHRTRQTVAPLAQALGLEVGLYDPRDPSSLAALEAALRMPGRHLVVGHSNTTPALVERLGGVAGGPMPESEYDRLYLVRIGADGVETTILRYGAPSGGGGAGG